MTIVDAAGCMCYSTSFKGFVHRLLIENVDLIVISIFQPVFKFEKGFEGIWRKFETDGDSSPF